MNKRHHTPFQYHSSTKKWQYEHLAGYKQTNKHQIVKMQVYAKRRKAFGSTREDSANHLISSNHVSPFTQLGKCPLRTRQLRWSEGYGSNLVLLFGTFGAEPPFHKASLHSTLIMHRARDSWGMNFSRLHSTVGSSIYYKMSLAISPFNSLRLQYPLVWRNFGQCLIYHVSCLYAKSPLFT